jgi:pimeloyl-ACP methyl ester carboxylesterase
MRYLLTLLFYCFTLAPNQEARAQGATRPAQSLAVDTAFLLPVNGVKQYLEIKGTSKTKPVLLFIHGGPAWPATPMNRKYNHDLANDFVFVSWDQRNCGKSQTDTTVALTPDLYIEDAHQVTHFLQKTFHQRKIFVVGHSWGSFVGVGLVQRYPQDYAAYVGMGQLIDFGQSALLTRTYVRQQAALQHDTATLHALARIPLSEAKGFSGGANDLFAFLAVTGKYTSSREVLDLADPRQLYGDYPAQQWMAPVMRTLPPLFPYLNGGKTKRLQRPVFKLPVYFFVGKYDHNTEPELARHYFAELKAPKKQLFEFAHSGHAPNWEEPALFHRRLVQIAAENTPK